MLKNVQIENKSHKNIHSSLETQQTWTENGVKLKEYLISDWQQNAPEPQCCINVIASTTDDNCTNDP